MRDYVEMKVSDPILAVSQLCKSDLEFSKIKNSIRVYFRSDDDARICAKILGDNLIEFTQYFDGTTTLIGKELTKKIKNELE